VHVFAQLRAIVKLTDPTDLDKWNWFAIVQYFRPEPLPSRKNNAAETCHFSAYSWEEHIVGSMRRRTYVVDIVSIESILDHALMIPDFTTDPVCGEPKNTDQFWMIPREFCDRSGWDNITSIIPPPLLPIVLPTSKEDSKMKMEVVAILPYLLVANILVAVMATVVMNIVVMLAVVMLENK
jgi:hypothetical protein